MPKSRGTTAWIVAAIVTGLVLLRLVGAFTPLESLLRWMTMPVARVSATILTAVRNALSPTPGEAALKDRNAELEARVSSLVVDYVRLRALEEENQSLHALVKFLNDTGYDQVPARIIGRSVDPRSSTVMIDRGSKDGLETGMAVVVDDGIFVGKITELQDRIATVTLVADEHSRVAGTQAGAQGVLGLVEGRGNGVAELTLVPQSQELKPNEVIITAGTEDKIPANLTIGLINDVEGKPTDPFQNAALEPLARMDRLSLVSVLRPSVLRPTTEKGI